MAERHPEPVPVGVLISGRGSNLKALLDAAQDAYRVAVVIANVVDAPGLDHAERAGVPVLARSHRGVPRDAFDDWLDDNLRAHGVAAVALAGYMRLLSAGFVARWAGRIVNIHPSLLPAHKGLDTHARVLAAGDRRHGCTVHLVTAALDDGPILAQAAVPVLAGDSPDTLAARVLAEEHRIYPRALAELVRSL